VTRGGRPLAGPRGRSSGARLRSAGWLMLASVVLLEDTLVILSALGLLE